MKKSFLQKATREKKKEKRKTSHKYNNKDLSCLR